ncbi:PepSY-associated TM helix domain-containing protein [Sphingomonas sp. RS6]
MSNTRRKQWRWPISADTVRSVLSSHSVLGLAFAAIIYLVCLTGTIAVFTPDLRRLESPRATMATTLTPGAAARALSTAAAEVPNDVSIHLAMPGSADEGASIVAYKRDYERHWAIAENGSLSTVEAAWTEFLIDLHIALHLPRTWGGFIVGLTGVALLSSLVSGILAHPRVIRDAFHLRLGGSRRLQEADLHNRLGIWALPFHFTLALTGALLGLSTLIVAVLALLLYRGDTAQVYAMFIDQPPPVNARAAPMPDLATLIARAQARMPGAAIDSVQIQRPARSDMRITVHGRRAPLLVVQDEVQFDARGHIVEEEHPRDLVVGTRILAGIGQLHFGWFGGWPVRIGYGLLGLALCVVTSSGVTIWLARRRDRGRAAPGWERIWAAVCWGQPVILTLTTILAFFAPGAPLTQAWLGMTVLAIAGAALWRGGGPAAHARLWRLALWASLGLALLLYGGRMVI